MATIKFKYSWCGVEREVAYYYVITSLEGITKYIDYDREQFALDIVSVNFCDLPFWDVNPTKSSSDDEGEHTGFSKISFKYDKIVILEDNKDFLSKMRELEKRESDFSIVKRFPDKDLKNPAVKIENPFLQVWVPIFIFDGENWFEVKVVHIPQIQPQKPQKPQKPEINISKDELSSLLVSEEVEYCGYPNDNRRNQLAKKYNVSRKDFDTYMEQF